ncbi:MAG: FitA-like ribbon-helix-helix domain-containing protein [Gaiellaceae bacterium]
MPAVHIRDVPDDVLATLRELARENKRSFNAELVATLEERARQHSLRGEATRRLAEIAARVRIPPGFPTPEELIRADRDSR